MTEGGKKHRDTAIALAPSAFAPLTPLLKPEEHDLDEGMRKLSNALRQFGAEVSLRIEVIDGSDVHCWEVESGAGRAAVHRRQPERADVRLVLRRETWLRIAQGSLNPFDAFAAGKVLVGGDTEIAKRVVQHLSDPRVPYVSPC